MVTQAATLDSQHTSRAASTTWQEEFLGICCRRLNVGPGFNFQGLKGEQLEEAVQEIVCHACQAYAQLVAQGRADVATGSTLAKFACKRYREGRREHGRGFRAVREVGD